MTEPAAPAPAEPDLPAAARRTASLPLATLLGHTADAVQAVRAGVSLNVALARCPAPARPGTQALSFHVLRWLGAAEVLRQLLAPKAPPPTLDALLLTALALLWREDEAPYDAHTLVDQAVEAAGRRAGRAGRTGPPGKAPAFVNAVLRRFLRERERLVDEALRDPLARFNHPRWWIERLQRDWPDRWEAILDADNQHPPMTLRVNARRGDAHAYVGRLAAAGLAATAVGAQAVVLAAPAPVTRLPGFAAGDASVQDAAAQRAAPLLIGATATRPGLAPGARVLDACAAPGGKTAHLLELGDFDLLAIDSDPLRLPRVDETLARLGLGARTRAADAATPAAWWDGVPFDAILLDAPCSASGIVRRHPDVRWLRRASDIPRLAATQARLLDALWPLLRPGGRMLFCTCSVFKDEGRHRIDAFLQRHPDAAAASDPPAPGHLLPLPDNAGEAQAHGGGAAADGFFYALLTKT